MSSQYPISCRYADARKKRTPAKLLGFVSSVAINLEVKQFESSVAKA